MSCNSVIEESKAPRDAKYAALVEQAKELKVLTSITRGYASFAWRHLADNSEKLLGGYSKHDCSEFWFDHPLAELRSQMDEVENDLFNTIGLIYHEICGFKPEDDTLYRTIFDEENKLPVDSTATEVLLQFAQRVHECVLSCTQYAHQYAKPSRAGRVEAAAHGAWMRVRSSLLAFGVEKEDMNRSMPHMASFSKLRNFVYGWSIPLAGLANGEALVKIGTSRKALEYYAAQFCRTELPATLSEYKSMCQSKRGAGRLDASSRIADVAGRFPNSDEARVLFLLGPFPSELTAKHCESFIRMLSGPHVPAEDIVWNPKTADGKTDFVRVDATTLQNLGRLNALQNGDILDDQQHIAEHIIDILRQGNNWH